VLLGLVAGPRRDRDARERHAAHLERVALVVGQAQGLDAGGELAVRAVRDGEAQLVALLREGPREGVLEPAFRRVVEERIELLLVELDRRGAFALGKKT